MTFQLARWIRGIRPSRLVLPFLTLALIPAHAQPQQSEATAIQPSLKVATAAVPPEPPQSPEPVNPVTGERLDAEALRVRLARLQVQSRIEAELTSIERSRQERQHLQSPEARTALPSFFPRPSSPLLPSKATMVAPKAPSAASAQVTGRDGVAADAAAISPTRLVAVLQDGTIRVGLAESKAGLQQLAPRSDAQGEDSFALDGRDLRLAQEPGHIELPRAPLRESRDTFTPGPAPASPAAADDPLASMRAGAQRLGIMLPAASHEGYP